mgnify:CR=1 FL=1
MPNYVSVIKFKILRWAGHVVRTDDSENAFKIIIGNPTIRKPVKSPKCNWEFDVEMAFTDLYIEGTNWIQMAKDKDQ